MVVHQDTQIPLIGTTIDPGTAYFVPVQSFNLPVVPTLFSFSRSPLQMCYYNCYHSPEHLDHWQQDVKISDTLFLYVCNSEQASQDSAILIMYFS